ncbi:MAG: hypothetical protein IH957_11670 [Chloroflexi bacterium]|nr:hypothetical protein [Chloroflexota bacterium]
MTNALTNIASRWWAVPAALLFGAALAAAFIAGYAWQTGQADSKLTAAVTRAETAVYLQETVKEATIATDLLEEYVLTGDQTLVPRIQNRSTTVSLLLSGAVAGDRSDHLRRIAVQGTRLAESAGAIIALRQAGEVEAAGAVLTDLRTQLEGFAVTIQTPIGDELSAAVSLTNSSDNADAAALWFLATGMAVAISTGTGSLLLVGRSLLRRRAVPSLHGKRA